MVTKSWLLGEAAYAWRRTQEDEALRQGYRERKVVVDTQAEEGQVVSGVLVLYPSPLHGLANDVVHHLDSAPLPEDHLLDCITVRDACMYHLPLKIARVLAQGGWEADRLGKQTENNGCMAVE